MAPICPFMRAVADRADRSARVSDLIRGGASDRRVRGQHKMLGLARFAEANDLYHSAGGGVTGSGVADGGALIGEVPALFDIAIDDIERLSHAGIVLPRRAEGMPYARVDLPLRRAHRAIAMDEQYRAATHTDTTDASDSRSPAELMPVVRYAPRVRLAIGVANAEDHGAGCAIPSNGRPWRAQFRLWSSCHLCAGGVAYVSGLDSAFAVV